jgi:N-acetylated-alpha-linked acidic dipeptidase
MAWTEWRDPAQENALFDALSLDAPWALIERFAGLVRESGTAAEAEAVAAITTQLEQWSIPYTVQHPVCLISLPRASALEVYGPTARTVTAKTPAMSVATGGNPLRGQLAYLPSGYARGVGDLFSATLAADAAQVAGKIVLTEGLPMPAHVAELTRLGARAAVFISPGERIHEGICTTIWGTPDLDSAARQPTLPVLEVNRSDGAQLIAEAQAGPVEVGVITRLETRWRPIPVLVAEIRGAEDPDRFVLLHGHLDSWHGGVGDNATGDALLLELARVFHQRRNQLRRTLRVAWWSGHSHGRYAGSTWYADEFALDLAEHCIAQVNSDSPGCRWATTYDHLTVMSETEALVRAAAHDATGLEIGPERPPRAGDYSFNNIGVSGCLMLSSTMAEADRAAHDYYAVGGCGGNIAWHTEDDTLEIADRDVLARDLRFYTAIVTRLINAPLHPLDFRQTVREMQATLARYNAAAEPTVSLIAASAVASPLAAELERDYSSASALRERPATDPAVQRFNAIARALSRLLVPVNYSRQGAFRHDPALDVPPLPDLAPALLLHGENRDSDEARVIRAHLIRGRNRLIWTLRQARALVAQPPG